MSDKTYTIEVADSRGFEPWHTDQFSIMAGPGRRVKSYITITDYGDDGSLDHATTETLRIRFKKGNALYVCAPEDDDEPDEFPDCYWKEQP